MASTNQKIAAEVLMGKWGNGAERRQRLTAAGYNYNAIQSIVNAMLSDKAPAVTEDQQTAPENVLKIEYDPNKYQGIEVTVIV